VHMVFNNGTVDHAVNTICNYDNVSGEAQGDMSGTVYLDIQAGGEWVIDIQELE